MRRLPLVRPLLGCPIEAPMCRNSITREDFRKAQHIDVARLDKATRQYRRTHTRCYRLPDLITSHSTKSNGEQIRVSLRAERDTFKEQKQSHPCQRPVSHTVYRAEFNESAIRICRTTYKHKCVGDHMAWQDEMVQPGLECCQQISRKLGLLIAPISGHECQS